MIPFLLVTYCAANLLVTLRLRHQLWGRGGFGGASALLIGVLVGAPLTLVVTGVKAARRSELTHSTCAEIGGVTEVILSGLLLAGLWYIFVVILFGIGG